MTFIKEVVLVWYLIFGVVKGNSISTTSISTNGTTTDSIFVNLNSSNSYQVYEDSVDNNSTAYFNSTNSTYYSETRIINGQIVLIQLFPYQVSLEYKNQFTCGGSIISSKWVLTAGHCVAGRAAKNFGIRAGSEFRGIGGVVHKVNRIVKHPLFLIYFFYDFALMEVKLPFMFINLRVSPIKLASKLPRTGTKVTVSGFGKTRYGSWNKPSLVLKAVDLKIVNHFLCNMIYYGILVDWTHFCANSLFRGPCNGDSGGPIIHHTLRGPELIGVVSWASRCSTLGAPSVYGNVAKVQRWIKRVANV